ncbi:endonuclease/exonuclease/phosphatase family protein [Planosporangium sp. 12N6]|uniref:endonuclease/exonuclease/phosphatase family protein n=1 Tax=Planosporangium spinosum TaxID=3402278 RepID=UPI003CE99BCF
MALTVMTYNIKNGGRGGRLGAIVRVVTGVRPDVLALQELRHYHRRGGRLMRHLADATGMCPFLTRSWLGQPVALLVRDPGAVVSTGHLHRPFHHAAGELTLRTDHGPLAVIGTHLYPFSGTRRLWEARWLSARAARDRMVLLMGDLNSLDPWRDHTERLRALPDRYRRRHLRASGEVDTRAIRALVDAGFVDLCRRAGAPDRTGTGPDHTVPTRYGGGGEFARMRLDYVLGTEPVARLVRSCRVVSGGAAESASDHYPVVAELDLTLRT